MDNAILKRHLPNLTNSPPGGGWQYTVPETSKLIGPYTGWHQLKENLERYYHSTAYPLPPNLFDLVEQQICEAQPEYCGAPHIESPVAKLYRETKHSFHAALQCLTTLVSHRAGSGERPSLEQQEARAKVCVACPKNSDITPCSICNIKSLRGLIKKLVGAKVTSVDSQLKFCAVCHCANSAKIATKHDAIWNHMPDWQKEQLPRAGVDGTEITCWLVTEQNEKEAKYETA